MRRECLAFLLLWHENLMAGEAGWNVKPNWKRGDCPLQTSVLVAFAIVSIKPF